MVAKLFSVFGRQNMILKREKISVAPKFVSFENFKGSNS